MGRWLLMLMILALAGIGVFWFITAPRPMSEADIAGLTGDAVRGETVFWAAGCASCHADEKAEGEEKLVLSGGQAFASPFGTFRAPNISPDTEHGIGGWSLLDLVNAMKRGISPDGRHYYPAFPYGSYVRASLQDIADLKAYLDTLPASAAPNQPHEVGFPFNIRRLLGGWKFLFLNKDWVVGGDLTDREARGRYLAEALGHCGECHTPRNALGGPEWSRWLAGAPNPAGKGSFPNITPGELDWSEADIAGYLGTGFTPEFDSAGGHMALVVENMKHLPETDRQAIAAYLKRVPASK